MAARRQNLPLPRTLPLLALPCGQVAGLHRAAFERTQARLAAAHSLPPASPVPPLSPPAAGPEPPSPASSPLFVVLFVPPNDLLPSFLEQHFAPPTWRVLVVHEPYRAAAALREPGVRLAILDFALPRVQELLDALKLASATNALPTVAFFPRRCDPDHPASLRIRADVEMSEPFEFARLLAVAQTQLARATPPPAAGPERAPTPPPADFHLRFVLPSTPDELERASDLATVLFRHSGLDPLNQHHLLAAFREAVGNAIQHGNRRDPSKAVRAEYHQDATQVTLALEDEGPGFDHHRFLQQAVEKEAIEAARRRHQEGGHGGLGILMIQRFADHLEFNEAGNGLTFSKLLRSSDGRRAEAGEPPPAPCSLPTAGRSAAPGAPTA